MTVEECAHVSATVADASARLLEQRLSSERPAPYRDAVGGDLNQALELYEWSARMGAVFWVALGHVEVLVRNAMHQQLIEWSTQAHSEPLWYLGPGRVLTDETRKEIAKARERARRGRRGGETPGRVLAELTACRQIDRSSSFGLRSLCYGRVGGDSRSAGGEAFGDVAAPG
jgi:hypothetical protein